MRVDTEGSGIDQPEYYGGCQRALSGVDEIPA